MHVTTLVAAVIALAGALVVLRWMPGLARPAADTAEAAADSDTPALEVAPPAGIEAALDVATEPRGIESDGIEVGRIDPIDALDVWQENLSARSPGGE